MNRRKRPHEEDFHDYHHHGGHHVAVSLDEEIEIRSREMRNIVAENRSIVDENMHLQREIMATKDEIQRLEQIIPQLQADKEAHARELIQRGLKLEAEHRGLEPFKAEVMHLRSEVKSLNRYKQELTEKVQGLKQEIKHEQNESKQLTLLKDDGDQLHAKLDKARMSLEYEKKANEELFEQKQALENNLLMMAQDMAKLRAELLNNERRAFGDGSYGMVNWNSSMRYPGDVYGSGGYVGPWGPYDNHGPSRR